MRVENGQLILGSKDCYCHTGTQPTPKWKHCVKCKGTGKRGRGRCRECNSRDSYYKEKRPGYVKWYDHDDLMPCQVCNGNYKDYAAETWMDTLPKEVFQDIAIELVRSGRAMTWAEQHLGAGIYTTIDYGAYKVMNDDELIAKVREGVARSHVQACKMVKSKDDLQFASGLAIVTGDQGYSVIPTWEETDGT